VCPAHTRTISPEAETALAMPWWVLGWDVVCWLGHRRFACHWSVGQIRAELADTYQIRLSDDAIERYISRYQRMLAARQHDPQQLTAAYTDVEAVMLAIDGLQPEKGHETLYVVRELEGKRVWFAEALLSSATVEVEGLLVQARTWAERLGKPVRLWMSDKQEADTVGEPRILVFIVLIRNFGQERRGEDPLTEREALAPYHISEDRLFLIIYYIKYLCSKKYI